MDTRIITVILGISSLSVGCSSGSPAGASDAGTDLGGDATPASGGAAGGTSGGGGTAGTSGGPAFAGAWMFSEMLVDQGLGLHCNDQGTWTFTQTGAAIAGQDNQTGTCQYTNGSVTDNGDSEAISNGSVNGASIMFTEAGGVPCVYSGTASGSPPSSMSGTISCVGTFQGTAYDTTGTWQATKQ